MRPMAVFQRLFNDTVPCIASWAVMNKPVYKWVCKKMKRMMSGRVESGELSKSPVEIPQERRIKRAIGRPHRRINWTFPITLVNKFRVQKFEF